MLVCMSATSNVTGIITDVVAVSKIAHKHGAMVVFDYAAGGKRKPCRFSATSDLCIWPDKKSSN